ncbi:MAG: ABC transporter ATP-binding protein, partial [Gammaproteobacteria bacterium]
MILTIDNLTFERNQHTLFSDIHCTLQSGEYLQVQGTNGCGKSTLLRILAGLIEPQEGHVLWQDQCIFENRDVYQRQLNYMGHQNGNKANLTVFENLRVSS